MPGDKPPAPKKARREGKEKDFTNNNDLRALANDQFEDYYKRQLAPFFADGDDDNGGGPASTAGGGGGASASYGDKLRWKDFDAILRRRSPSRGACCRLRRVGGVAPRVHGGVGPPAARRGGRGRLVVVVGGGGGGRAIVVVDVAAHLAAVVSGAAGVAV